MAIRCHALADDRVEAIVRGEIESASLEKPTEPSRGTVQAPGWFGRYRETAKPLTSASIQA